MVTTMTAGLLILSVFGVVFALVVLAWLAVAESRERRARTRKEGR